MKKIILKTLSGILISFSLFAVHTSAFQTGWVSNIINGHVEWEYIYSDMTAPMGWTYIDGDWYFFGEDGVANSNLVLKSGNYDYYLKNDCRMAHDEWIHPDANTAVLLYTESDGHINYDKITYDNTINKDSWN
jgi:hypothetical protein